MAINFPSGLDSLTNPSSTDPLSSPDHATQHSDVNDAIEALEAKVGVNNSTNTSSLDYKVRNPSLVGGAARPLLTGGAYLNGSTGLVLTGLASNYASTPDANALDITGDIEIIFRAKINSTSAVRMFVDKRGASGGYCIYWDPNNGWTFQWHDGTAYRTLSSAVYTPDNSVKWYRFTLDVDNGSNQRTLTSYRANDSSTVPTSWTTEATVNGAGTTTIANSTAPLTVGAVSSMYLGASVVDGTIYRAIVNNGIGGTTVFDADFSSQTADALAFTESSANAATVTINTTRYYYGVPGVQFNGVQYTLSQSANNIFFEPFVVTTPIIVDMARFVVTVGPASNANVKMAIYAADSNLQATGSPIFETGNVAVSASITGTFSAQSTPVTLQPGIYLAALWNSVTMTFGYMAGGINFLRQATSNQPVVYFSVLASFGAFPSSPQWTFGEVSARGFYHGVQLRWRAA